MKKIFLISLLTCLFFSACSEKQSLKDEKKAEKTVLLLGVPKAPPTLPLLRMIETKALGENIELKLDFWGDPATLIAMVQDKKHHIFAFPLTVVSKLFNKGQDVRLLNVSTWGATYFLSSDEGLNSWEQLKGKTIYAPLQSSPPDILTQFFLKDAGVDKDVKIIYSTMPEVAGALLGAKAQYATMLEPLVTKVITKDPKIRVVFSFEKEYQRVTKSDKKIPNAGMGSTQSFISAHPLIVQNFQKEYEKAVKWANENPKEMGELAKKYLGLEANIVAKALPTMGLFYKSAKDAKPELDSFYELLLSFNKASVGGKLASKELYYEAK